MSELVNACPFKLELVKVYKLVKMLSIVKCETKIINHQRTSRQFGLVSVTVDGKNKDRPIQGEGLHTRLTQRKNERKRQCDIGHRVYWGKEINERTHAA